MIYPKQTCISKVPNNFSCYFFIPILADHEGTVYVYSAWIIVYSVPKPWHFGMDSDPDPRICTFD
jgi:hypothetical protein